MKINYDQLYQFEDPLKRAFRANVIEKFYNQMSLKIFRGELTPESKITYQYHMGGSKPSDIIWTGMFNVLIEQSIANLLNENGITGYTLYDVVVYGKNMEKYENYYGLSITGRCNTIDYHRSEIIYLGSANVPNLKGIHIENDNWDGSDFFVENPDEHGDYSAHIFVSEKIVKLFEKYKVKNVQFEKFNESTTNLRDLQILKSYKLPIELREISY